MGGRWPGLVGQALIDLNGALACTSTVLYSGSSIVYYPASSTVYYAGSSTVLCSGSNIVHSVGRNTVCCDTGPAATTSSSPAFALCLLQLCCTVCSRCLLVLCCTLLQRATHWQAPVFGVQILRAPLCNSSQQE